MKKYYIVDKDSEVYKGCLEYEKFKENITRVFCDFADENNIKAKKFLINANRLWIVPESEDIENFDRFMSKTQYGLFKKNSELSKKWVLKCQENNLKQPEELFIPFLFDAIGKVKWSLFSVKENVYCTFESDYDFKTPKNFTEIKARDFYKIMEENEVKVS